MDGKDSIKGYARREGDVEYGEEEGIESGISGGEVSKEG